MPHRKHPPEFAAPVVGDVFREKSPFEVAIKRLYGSLFDKQKAVVNDKSSPYRVLCCSRRAGKTQLIARYLLMRAFQVPNSEVLYLATTAKSAREIVWDGPSGIPAIIRHLGLESFCKINETKTSVQIANGTTLHVSGAESKVDAARWQGHAYTIVVFDESQDWPEEILAYTLREVIGPALLDFGGEMLMAGVPKPLCAGSFYNAAEGKSPAWARHHWTVFDNQKLPPGAAEKWVKEELARFAEKEEDPGPQRRFWGRWVRDGNAQLYQYLADRNDFEELPTRDDRGRHINWQHVLGIDLGHRDLTTFTLLAWSPQTPKVYGLESRGEEKAIDSKIASVIKNFQVRYGSGIRLIGDTGGLGLMIVEGLRDRYGIAIEAAVKKEKAAAIRMMNTAFRSGDLLLRKDGCKELIEQLQMLEMDKRTEIEKPSDACDYADSLLYSWRWTFAYVYKEPKKPLTQDEQWKQKEAAAWERTQKQFPEGGPEEQIMRELADWTPPPELDF